MSATNRDPSVTSDPEPVDDPTSNLHSLSRAVLARKSEYVRPHRIRIKVGTWNVAGCPGTDKDLASWFVDGKGVEPHLDANLARMNLSESGGTIEINGEANATSEESAKLETDSGVQEGPSNSEGSTHGKEEEPKVRILGGDKIGLYVLGLQEIVNLNIVTQTFYSDPDAIAKWQSALEAALPKGYTLVACEQLVGLLLLIYASPEVAETISNESTVSVGTGIYGLLGYWGNKGAISSRILLGETTRLVFTNCHLASGHDQASLDRRCWDYNRIVAQTKFTPIKSGGIVEDEGEKIGDEDFAFWLGDLNFRLDGLPGEDIRRLLMLHTRGEYDLSKKHTGEIFSDDGVIVLRNNDDDDGSNTPGMISREASFDKNSSDEDTELPDPDDFVPDPHDDPASLQATLDSLLPHDQLKRMIKERKAFHEGWREGPITFLPTYKYDVGTIGLFDSSEKQRAPSWCDRILFRTRTDFNQYEKKCQDEIEAKKKDEEMKKMGIDKAAEDENVLFDYDPSTDSSSSDNPGYGDATAYEYDEYDEAGDTLEQVVTKEGYIDQIKLDIYTSHQRIMSSDHKPIVAMFTLDYDAVVPDLKAKVHAEVARELDRAENEGRPGITVIVDGKGTDRNIADGSEGVDFGEIGFLRKETRSLTIANTGGVPAKFGFIDNPTVQDDATKPFTWLEFKFVSSQVSNDDETQNSLGNEITLEPGETVNAVIEAHVYDLTHVRALNEETAQLEDVLILRVIDGRDHFIPIRATWIPTCFGRSLEELIRVPRGGGIRALVEQRQKGGSIPYTLEVHKSSPHELFQLTEAVATLAERVIADENMLEEAKVPRDQPGWPFDSSSWSATSAEDHDELRAAIIEALEEDKPLLETIGADVPALKRLEIMNEVLLLFLRSMPDGIITAALWAKIEQTLPNMGGAKTSVEAEDAKAAILDILATAPYHNISFVFLMSMLTRVANELVPLNKEELEALRKTGSGASLGKRSLSFRRSTGGPAIDQAAIQRRLAWERRAAEIFGVAICRAPVSANAKERKATEDKMRGVVEVFLRQDRT